MYAVVTHTVTNSIQMKTYNIPLQYSTALLFKASK